MIKVADTRDFSIRQIADSGQCFRWTVNQDNSVTIIAKGSVLTVRESEDHQAVLGDCTEEELRDLWWDYFDLDTDYTQIKNRIPTEDAYLFQAAQAGSGIRILRQDPWEMLITFILSQRRSIPAIRTGVDKLCTLCGRRIRGYRDEILYAFPSPEQIAARSLQELQAQGMGYRAQYVLEAARTFAQKDMDPDYLKTLDDLDLETELCSLYGVGVKVASCTSLFGFHRLNAFPNDVWIGRVLKNHYPSGFDFEQYQPYNGVMQQYLFYYARFF